MIVRLAARDPGGANVLSSFLQQSRSESLFTTDVWALPKAAEVFARAGAAVREFPESVTAGVLEDEWRRDPADVLVTATTHQTPFEAILWDIARQHGAPSLAVLDQWCNLPSRFQGGRPDSVGVIDAGQARELIELGFAPQVVRIVGHPWLADLLDRRSTLAPVPRREGEDRDAVAVLFVSENISGDVRDGRNAPFGFDEIDSFEVLYQAACATAALGTPVVVAVKFHPYEDPARFRDHLGRLNPPAGVHLECVPLGAEPHAWVLWADLVVGISSMLLYEAMVLERPIVSVQPGLVREDTFAASERGFARTLTDRAQAITWLRDLLLDPEQRRTLLEMHRGFTGRLPRSRAEGLLAWIRASMPAST